MAGSHSLFFLACLCLARDLVFCSEYEETGKAITLTPSIRGKPVEILWKHDGNKVLEYDGSELVEYGLFRGRVVVDFETGQLTITELNRQDSGQYQSDFIVNGEIQTFSYTLTVLDVLAEPQVTCEPDKSSKVKKLLCSVESQTPLSYEWSGQTITAQSGPELRVEEQEENRDSVFTCTVKNPANSKSTSFNLRDCRADGAGAAVIVPAVIVPILLILLIVLAVILYKRKQKSRPSDVRKTDLENGEGQNLLKKNATRSMPGSSEATLPCHNRLPAQKESIADKKWDQAEGLENSGPQSVSETKQEDTGNGNEREIEENEENNKRSVEANENSCCKPDEMEKERQNSLQSQDEEHENNLILKQESVNGENEQKPEDNNEDDLKPGETAKGTCGRDTGEDQTVQRNDPPDVMTACDRPAVNQPSDGGAPSSPARSFLHSRDTQFRFGSSEATLPCHNRLPAQKESIADKKWDQAKGLEYSGPQSVSETNQEETGNGNKREDEENNKIAVEAKEVPCSKPDEKERQNSLQSQDEENDKNPTLKQESANEEKSPEHQNETLEEQKPEDDNEDKQMPAEGTCERDPESESPQSAVKEGSTTETDNEEEQVHEDEKKSQSDDRELEQQNESPRNPEDDMRPGERKERSEEKDHEGIDRASPTCDRPAVDQPSDGGAPSSPARSFLHSRDTQFRFDSPANVEKETINVSPVNQTDPTDNTDQNKEETTCPSLEQDEKEKVATNQEQKDVKEQMPEEKDHEPGISEETDEQTDPDSKMKGSAAGAQ